MAALRAAVRVSTVRGRAMTQVRSMLNTVDARGFVSADGAWIDLSREIAASVTGTRLVGLSEGLGDADPLGAPCDVEVTRESTVGAALRLYADHTNVAVLNFASATTTGGLWHVGYAAQEEELIRHSTLLEPLHLAADAFYEAHRVAGPPMFADVCLYSPSVLIISDGVGATIDSPPAIGVLTCAAPRADLVRDRDEKALRDVLHRRLGLVLARAAAAGHRHLVLGAWGCGAYGNSPEVVAAVFAGLLRGPFRSRFEVVAFAIRDHSRDGRTFRTFATELGV